MRPSRTVTKNFWGGGGEGAGGGGGDLEGGVFIFQRVVWGEAKGSGEGEGVGDVRADEALEKRDDVQDLGDVRRGRAGLKGSGQRFRRRREGGGGENGRVGGGGLTWRRTPRV
jgi:hypothetical protein